MDLDKQGSSYLDKIDWLMAAKVLGWTWDRKRQCWTDDQGAPRVCLLEDEHGQARNVYLYNAVTWHPTSNLNDAVTLARQLSGSPHHLMTLMCQSHDSNLCSAMVLAGTAMPYPPKDIFLHLHDIDEARRNEDAAQFGIRPPVRAQAETMQLALCLALLEWFGLEVPV